MSTYTKHYPITATLEQPPGALTLDTCELIKRADQSFSAGDYVTAKPLLMRAIAAFEQEVGTSHSMLARLLSKLAFIYKSQGRLARAEGLYTRALAVGERALGASHKQVTACQTELAAVLRVQGRYAEAESLYLRVLAAGQAQLLPEYSETAHALHGLALIYHAQEKYQEAEPLYRQALALRQKLLGSYHPEVAVTSNRLANLYLETGRLAQAALLYKGVMAMEERGVDINHPELITARQNYQMMERQEERKAGPDDSATEGGASASRHVSRADAASEAERNWRQVLSRQHLELFSKKTELASTMTALAASLYKQGKYAESCQYLEKAFFLYAKRLSWNDRQLVSAVHNLAVIYHALGRFKLARRLYKTALILKEHAAGNSDPWLLRTLDGLARLTSSLGQYDQCGLLWQQAGKIRRNEAKESYAAPSQKAKHVEIKSGPIQIWSHLAANALPDARTGELLTSA